MAIAQTALDALTDLLGGRFSTAMAERDLHAASESFHRAAAPDAVAWPETTAEISAILKICHAHDIPVIGWGAGTSLEGHALATQGGLTLDLMRMDKVLSIEQENMLATVQPGVTREALNTDLRATGLFFPVDPGANASLGGMAATRASGTTAVRYGTMRDNVLALEAVLADGTIIRTGCKAAKSSAGYDLTALLVGSEGTLAIITELTLRLHGQPEDVSAAVCGFATLEEAVACVAMTMAAGIPMARIEFLDAASVQVFNTQSGTDWPETPHLMAEFHGSPEAVKAAATAFGEIVAEFDGQDFRWASSAEERAQLWAMRHQSYWNALKMRPGAVGVITDVCVPMASLPEAVAEAAKDLKAAGLPATIVGHVGDGNFHSLILIDPDSKAELEAAKTAAHAMARRALAVGGTITGEHGIGIGKRDLMEEQHGAGAIAAMRAIKAALDPKNIMNPGKMLP